jgi:hypothetical protein
VTIAGKLYTVTQAAAAASAPLNEACTYVLGRTSSTEPTGGGADSVKMTAGTGCTWTTRSDVSGLTVLAGSGSGNGWVTYSVAKNTTGGTRTGTLTIAGKTFTVTQP